ncbi:DUF881 domain-containing protein [Paenalkalicoccus suaedae]|uniref:DUF881 domain-containing protein n=2 Tax=Paenalkalicoccus suaedae TaxID=2592382 RepID=A0A859FKD3_9BACI|nr:DUF881 domain-containing protein [Paenalkalicoccus suaedae]
MLTFVLLVTGFLVAWSMQTTSNRASESQVDSWELDDELRLELLNEQEATLSLEEELQSVQQELQVLEDTISQEERTYFNYIEDIDRLRMVTGEVPVKGMGIEVTLDDAEYIPGSDNPNDYIVHEQHLQVVIDELLVAGAEAIAINGYRINHQSAINCIGPVIDVDGNTSFAPFVITAIGEQETLEESLQLTGGVTDQLVNENVQVRVEKQSEVYLERIASERG